MIKYVKRVRFGIKLGIQNRKNSQISKNFHQISFQIKTQKRNMKNKAFRINVNRSLHSMY